MPASYAHYRFGREILPQLPEDARQCIRRFRRMYDMGLHGPDIFFFYNPLMKTAVGDLSGRFHRQTGREFFAYACTQANSEAAQAYLYGLLAHYCLDSVSHPFVQQKVTQGETSHGLMESEFDRYLMTMDGIPEPSLYDLSPKLKLTRGECMTVAAFYPGATGGNVNLSVKNMALMHKFGASKNRARTGKILKKLKPSLLDGLIPAQPLEGYTRMNSELLVRFNRAMKHYVPMLQQLRAHMTTEAELGEEFLPDFG